MPDFIIAKVQRIAIKERKNRNKSTKIRDISDDNEAEGTKTTSAIVDTQPSNDSQEGKTKEDENIDPIVDHNDDQSSINENKDEEKDIPNNGDKKGPSRNTPIVDDSTSTEINNVNTNANVLDQHTHKYETRSKREVRSLQYNKVFGNDYQFALILTQMSAQKGIKIFGQQAIDALAREWKQLDELTVFKGRKYETISKDQRKAALRTVQLVKKKKDGKIKRRTCVNGSRQRIYTNEEDASSPTVSTEGLLLTAAIDASENRYIATCDITGAYLKADMDEFVLIVLHDKEMDALVQANKIYTKHVHKYPNGKKVIYLQLNKAMYGCLKSARLFWEHLSNYLAKMGFVQNFYNSCVANKLIEGNLCTIAWHIDDLAVLQVWFVDNKIKWLK